MDFELKTLNRARMCAEKCDALVVLVPQDCAPGDDALSKLMTSAIRAGDFEPKSGKLLQAYRSAGLTATRVLLVGVGEGTPKNIRAGVTAAMAALKGGKALRLVLSMSLLKDAGAAQMQAAVLAAADAAYEFKATKS
jgi:leucyl aminopeptidase